MCKVKQLSSGVIDGTIAELAKSEDDKKRLLATRRLLKIVHRAFYQNTGNSVDQNVLQFPKQNNQSVTSTLQMTVNQSSNSKLVKIR